MVLKPFMQILCSTCGLIYRECQQANEPALCETKHVVAPQASKHTNIKYDSPLDILPISVPAKLVGYFYQAHLNFLDPQRHLVRIFTAVVILKEKN